MKTTRPSFACGLFAGARAAMAALAITTLATFSNDVAQAQQPAVVAAAVQAGGGQTLSMPPDAARGSSAAEIASQQAENLVLHARQLIDGYDSIECSTRHRIMLFDHQILGAGHYYQQGHGVRRATHFELRSQLGARTDTRLEISDGNFFWTFHQASEGSTLARVDLVRVFQAWDQARHTSPAVGMREPATSGLPKLLDGLASDFRFERVANGRLGDRPVWVVEGSWRRDKLAAAVPDQKSNIEAGRPLDLRHFPSQLPERVVLEFAQSDDLFPCQIEYLRRTKNSAAEQGRGGGEEDGGGDYRAIVSMQWFDVRINRPIDPQKFVYQPTGQAFTDGTDECIKSLGLSPAK